MEYKCAVKKKQRRIMVYLIAIIILYLVVISFIVDKLRKERDELDLTTPTGKLRCREINKAIDLMNGFWLWSLLKKK